MAPKQGREEGRLGTKEHLVEQRAMAVVWTPAVSGTVTIWIPSVADSLIQRSHGFWEVRLSWRCGACDQHAR